MRLTGPLFDAVNLSQDGHPLSKYLRRRAETMIDEYDLHVGECVNETICQAFSTADDVEELLSHLRYAVQELDKAARAVESAALHQDATQGDR